MAKNNIRIVQKVKVEDLRPSKWRYSKVTSTDRKLAYVLKLRGQTMPILVRDVFSEPATPENPVNFTAGEVAHLTLHAALDGPMAGYVMPGPGTVTKFDHYEIIDGHRVWEAMKSLGMKTCTVVSVGEGVSDVDALLMALERNESRGPINHIALAYLFQFLNEKEVRSDEIASRIDFDTEQVECYRGLANFDLDAYSKSSAGWGQGEIELMAEAEDLR